MARLLVPLHVQITCKINYTLRDEERERCPTKITASIPVEFLLPESIRTDKLESCGKIWGLLLIEKVQDQLTNSVW